jgi:NADH-quinone oxidoreductase subunit N
MNELLRNLASFWPETLLTLGLLLVVLADASGARWRAVGCRWLTIATLAGALYALVQLARHGATGPIWSGMLVLDPLGLFFKCVLVLAALLVVLAFTFENSRELFGLGQGEFYALLLALTLSNLLMVAANDLVMLYLALEMVSITSYVMVAYIKGDRQSNEASLKYILFGAVSTGAMLYGLSLLYGMTGTTSLPGVRAALAAGFGPEALMPLYLIVLLVTAGFGFKIAAVPFHFWCPDVYQGAPTPVTALLSVAPKAAGFGVLLRFFSGGLTVPVATGGLEPTIDWPSFLMVISIATMTIGNLAAITQTDMKRLLAYSSIAHAGFMLMGVVALSPSGTRGLLIYVLVYLVMNLGAFLVVTLIHRHEGTFDLRDYGGMLRRQPLLTGAMAVFLLSLMGIPPLTGFMGKLYVFLAVIERGPRLYGFAVIGALNAALAAWYYMRVLRVMIVDDGEARDARPAFALPFADRAWLVVLALANVVPLVFWDRIEGWARGALTLYAAGL